MTDALDRTYLRCETFRAVWRLPRMYSRRTDAGILWVWAFLGVAVAMIATGVLWLVFAPLS